MTGNMAIALGALVPLFLVFVAGVLLAKTGIDSEHGGWFVFGVVLVLSFAGGIYAVVTLTYVADGREAWRLSENPDGSRTWRMVETRKERGE